MTEYMNSGLKKHRQSVRIKKNLKISAIDGVKNAKKLLYIDVNYKIKICEKKICWRLLIPISSQPRTDPEHLPFGRSQA